MGGRNRAAAVILDPSLRSEDGHHFGAVQRLKAEFSRLETGVVCLTSRYLDKKLCRREDFVPIFEKSIYAREHWTKEEFRAFAKGFFHELKRSNRTLPRNPNVLVLPSGDQSTTLGLAKYLKRYRPPKKVEVLIWLLMAPHFRKAIDDPGISSLLEEYTEAFALLREAVKDDARIHVFCETEVMAEVYSRAIGLKVDIVSSPNMILQPRDRKVRRGGEPIVIVCAGNANAAKGYGLLPEAIKKARNERRDLRFLVHGTVENTDFPEGRRIFDCLSTLGGDVTVRTDALSSVDYSDWLAQADLILLPYDPSVYKTRGSGLFVEAETLGIPVVVTEGCAFAKVAIEEKRAVRMMNYTSDDLANAILHGANCLHDVTAQAERFAAAQSAKNDIRKVIEATMDIADDQPNWINRIRRCLKII